MENENLENSDDETDAFSINSNTYVPGAVGGDERARATDGVGESEEGGEKAGEGGQEGGRRCAANEHDRRLGQAQGGVAGDGRGAEGATGREAEAAERGEEEARAASQSGRD